MVSDDAFCLGLLSVSWPRPVQRENGRWTSDPAWDAPIMPVCPAWRFQMFDGVAYHALDWTDFFRSDLTRAGQPTPGEMRGFHVVFRLRAHRHGLLVCYETGGSIIRRNGEIVHEVRDACPLTRYELEVHFGDRLEIAQWQLHGHWSWGVRWEVLPTTFEEMLQDVVPYRRRVEEALTRPNGPMLKVCVAGADPVRGALAVYSMILNGYRPAGVQIFGEQEWDVRTRGVMGALLPFADIVSTERLERTLEDLHPRLIPLTRRSKVAMRLCVGLLFPPHEYCLMDDDLFVLDRIDDALELHVKYAFVHAGDGTALYFATNTADRVAQGDRLLQTPPDDRSDGPSDGSWERACLGREFPPTVSAVLPTQRYLATAVDGLPGGLLGYDWRANPCDFVTVQFGDRGRPRAHRPKPRDEHAGALMHEILDRHRTAT